MLDVKCLVLGKGVGSELRRNWDARLSPNRLQPLVTESGDVWADANTVSDNQVE